MLTEAEPTGTVLVDVKLNGRRKGKRMLIYQNSMNNTQTFPHVHNIGLETQPSIKANNELMVVPFPLQPGKYDEVELVAHGEVKQLVQDLLNADMQQTFNGSMLFGVRSFGGEKKAIVHDIGNYKISVAHNLDALSKNIDWSQFKLPADFHQRFDTLKDTSLYPFPCGYVIAQANKSVSKDGFGIIYPFDKPYFPTAHEGKGIVKYDVDCFSVSDQPGQKQCYTRFNNVIPTTNAATGKEDSMYFDIERYPFNTYHMHEMGPNRNIIVN